MWLTVTTLAAFAASVSAVGKSVVINHSLDTLYLWSVGDATGPEVTVAPSMSLSQCARERKSNVGQTQLGPKNCTGARRYLAWPSRYAK